MSATCGHRPTVYSNILEIIQGPLVGSFAIIMQSTLAIRVLLFATCVPHLRVLVSCFTNCSVDDCRYVGVHVSSCVRLLRDCNHWSSTSSIHLLASSYIMVYPGPPPPSGTVQRMYSCGILIEQHLQCTQFCALMTSSGAPVSSHSLYS
jgi:hypothetical protein